VQVPEGPLSTGAAPSARGTQGLQAIAGLSTSWTRRLFERTGLATPLLGFSIVAVLSLCFLIQELALGRFDVPDDALLGDVRLTLTHILIAVYLVTAYVYCEQTRDEAIASLAARLDASRAQSLLDTRRRDQALLTCAGLVGVAGAILSSLFLTPGPASYDPQTWASENGWHRVLSLFMGYWTGRLGGLIVIESGRLSDLAGCLGEIDLLDPGALAPFARRGLSNALLAIGAVSAYALFLVDLGYLYLVVLLLVFSVAVGGLALWLPLRGARARVREAKQRELAWCRERLHVARADLGSGTLRAGELQELVAWERRVAAINEWPVDASTFTRFALYLLIPLGSWAGGALVERLIDAALD